MTSPGYHDSSWPVDGGSGNRSGLARGPGLSLGPMDHLVGWRRIVEGRPLMFIHREPGQLYLAGLTDQSSAWVEVIDPVTLEPITRSPELDGAGGQSASLIAHNNGDLYITVGPALHRLGPNCQLKASVLPETAASRSNQAGSNLLVLDDGMLVTSSANSDGCGLVTVYDPELRPVATLETPEPVAAGIAAVGDDVYVCGPAHLFRMQWADERLTIDTAWQPSHGGDPINSSDHGPMIGPVVSNGRVWVANNASPPSTIDPALSDDPAGAVTAPPPWTQPIKAIGVATDDPADLAVITPTDVTGGWVISAPLAYDNLVLAWDTANTGLAAFELSDGTGGRPVMIWYQPFRPSIPPLLHPDSGELVINDFRLLENGETSDDLVVLDIRTGQMKARVPTGSPHLSTGRLCPGFDRDVYYCSRSSLVRFRVESL